jgi:predicted alpha/beta-fold hydrolase
MPRTIPSLTPPWCPTCNRACVDNPHIDLRLTRRGGHVGYFSGARGQAIAADPDPWWAWNRVLDWVEQQTTATPSSTQTVSPAVRA